jgi:hypothetical protein
VPHPKLDETRRATGAVPQVGISESAEDVVTRLVCSRELVDVSQLFEGFVQVTTDDVRLRQGLALMGAEQEAGFTVADVYLKLPRL